MSCQFALILERELQAVGLPSPAASSCASEAATASNFSDCPSMGDSLPLKPDATDRTNFSTKAINLSSSLRQYARDVDRPTRSDPSLVTGWSEAGYLRDTGQGLSGEMRFTTASGVAVTITAGANGERGADIRVRAARDGVEHSFSLDDFSGCRREGTETPVQVSAYAALPGGATSSGNASGSAEQPQIITYSARSTSSEPVGAAMRPARALVC